MRILILGSDCLADSLRRLGHEVYTCGPAPGADLRLGDDDPDWRQIEPELKRRGLALDAVLVTDDVGRRKLPTGLWRAQAVTVFYGIDAPLNRFWQFPYARLFDAAFLDQKPQADELAKAHGGAGWLPVAVDPALYEGPLEARQKPGVCFVGVVNPRVRPKRSALLAKVAAKANLVIRGGRQDKWFPTEEAARLYRSHQLVLNENLFPGVTTRPLEGMAAGGCVLTEAAPGQMDLFFNDGEHLAYFDPDSLEQKLEQYLGDAGLRRRVAEAGRELVRVEHGFEQRAAVVLEKIEELSRFAPEERPRAQGGNALWLEGEALLLAGLRWPQAGGGRRLLRAAGRTMAAAHDGAEPLGAARAAGLAALAVGRPGRGLDLLARAASLGGPADGLALLLAAGQAGKRDLARQRLAGLGCEHPGLEDEPGSPEYHLAAARLLAASGVAACPGFDRRGLPPVYWTALEHLGAASRLAPERPEIWEELGDLLMGLGAPVEAHHCFSRAAGLAGSDELAAKLDRSARQGYLA